MGRNTIYPYTKWADGEWHDIDPAEYSKTLPTLRAILHQYAAANRYTLTSVALPGGILSVRFRRRTK